MFCLSFQEVKHYCRTKPYFPPEWVDKSLKIVYVPCLSSIKLIDIKVLQCNKKAIHFLAEFQPFRSSTVPNVSQILERDFDIWNIGKLCTKYADTRLKDASCPKGNTYKYTSNLLLQPFQSYTCWINLVSNPITIVVKWTTWLFQYTYLKKSVCYTW